MKKKDVIGKRFLVYKEVKHLGIKHTIMLDVKDIEKISPHLFKVSGKIFERFTYADGSATIVNNDEKYMGRYHSGSRVFETNADFSTFFPEMYFGGREWSERSITPVQNIGEGMTEIFISMLDKAMSNVENADENV